MSLTRLGTAPARTPPGSDEGRRLPNGLEWQGLGPCHPLHLIDGIVRETLEGSRNRWRPFLPPSGDRQAEEERLLRSLLLQVLYSIECDGRLLEQLCYDLRFRWFAGFGESDTIWTRAAYSNARATLLRSDPRGHFLGDLLRNLRPIALTWPEHFVLNETLVDGWRSMSTASAGGDEAAVSGAHDLVKAAGSDGHSAEVNPKLIGVLERILMRICDPDLDCASLAADIGMSRRALYYLFDTHALTPTSAIRNLRLEHCKRLLEDQRHDGRKVAAIALDHGFTSVCTFSRSFKQRYGFSPRDCRARRPARSHQRASRPLRQSIGSGVPA